MQNKNNTSKINLFITLIILVQIIFTGQVSGSIESDTHLKNANALSRTEKWNEAIVEYNKTLELDSENTEALANLGVAYSRLNNHKKALLNYEKALIKGYDNAMFRYFRGLSFANLSLLDEAVKEINLALQMNPRLMEAKFDLGIIYQMRGQSGLAREQVKKLYSVSPKLAKKLFDKVSPVCKY